MSREPPKEELISTGEKPLVPDEDLEAGERNVRGLSAESPGFPWRWTQVGTSWKMNIWCSGSGLDVGVRLSNHLGLLWESLPHT